MTLSADEFELILQANRIISSKLDVDDVLQAILELASKVVQAEASSLLLLDEKTNELYFNVALGSVGESVKQIRIKVGEGIAGWVAKEQKPLIVNDVTKDARFTGKVDKSTSFQTRSILAVPLIAKGQLVGVVEAINKEKSLPFTPGDLEAFEVFASQSAIAIQNARLFSEIRREKEKLDTVFSEMSDGLIYVSATGEISICNTAAGTWLGLRREDLIDKPFSSQLFPQFDVTPAFRPLKDLTEKISAYEFSRKEGKELILTVQVHQFGSPDQKQNDGWLIIISDSTEEKKEEKLKRNFLSLISHKLKTPLTVIIGYTPVLQAAMANLSEIQKKAVQSISDQGEQLSTLVDKLLRFAFVESEKIKGTIRVHQLKDLLDEAMDSLSYLIEEKKVRVDMDEVTRSSLTLQVDSSLTVEVFKNLIENAVKFNDKDQKTLRIKAHQSDGMVFVSFEDNGTGIPSEDREKVFQKFYQIENFFTGQVPGAGLGLPFCKKVMEEMGGSIRLESELQQGTQVKLTFPTGTQ